MTLTPQKDARDAHGDDWDRMRLVLPIRLSWWHEKQHPEHKARTGPTGFSAAASILTSSSPGPGLSMALGPSLYSPPAFVSQSAFCWAIAVMKRYVVNHAGFMHTMTQQLTLARNEWRHAHSALSRSQPRLSVRASVRVSVLGFAEFLRRGFCAMRRKQPLSQACNVLGEASA
jgi:hypothetical protein